MLLRAKMLKALQRQILNQTLHNNISLPQGKSGISWDLEIP